MDPILEKVRDLAIQEIDRRSDIARVLQSGRWPGLIINTWIWRPKKIVSGRLRLDQDAVFRWSRSLMGAEERNQFQNRIDRLHELAGRDILYSIDYNVPVYPRAIFWILVDPHHEYVFFNHLQVASVANPQLLEEIAPGAEERKRLEDADTACRKELAAIRSARDEAEKLRREWSLKRFPIVRKTMQTVGITCTHCRRRSNDFLVRPPTMICRSCGQSHRPEDIPGETPPPLPAVVPYPFVRF